MGSRKFILVLCFITIIFFATSLQLFNEVYRKTNTVIDELFHIRQGKAFCEQNFTSWDPKITTLPGLYLVTSLYNSLVFKSKGLVFVFGLSSVMMRQTNVLWVAMVLGHKILDLLIRTSRVFGNQHLSGLHVGKHSLLAKDIDSSKLKRDRAKG
ncbi:unnamed protein product [Leptidea sinapis]|uniref:Dol-P-Glc:Glc(2)Man(9)GlcNAc(2)-PP-Dol alpha-1,2-glucosyltransferase n=1 Tax=Leptidea sinapis TaxID=189913 RepID=A0A5E4QHY7_9NEOP|nr:unnamed protein product [Leptidea sinapis]